MDPVWGYTYKPHGTQSCPRSATRFRSSSRRAANRAEVSSSKLALAALIRHGRDPVISLSLLFFHAGLELIAHLGNHGSNRSNRLLDISVKSTSGRFLNSFYPSRGSFSWEAPQADKYQRIGDLKLDGMRH